MKPVGFIKDKCHTESNRTITDDSKLYKHYCGFISVWVMYSMVKIKQNLALDKSNNSLLRGRWKYIFWFASAPAWIFAATSKYFIVRRTPSRSPLLCRSDIQVYLIKLFKA